MSFRPFFSGLLFFYLIFGSNTILVARLSYIAHPAIGSQSPAFQAESSKGNIVFPEDFSGKWVILFSFPNVFAPLCTSELKAFLKEQNNINAVLLGISTNSQQQHIEWLKSVQREVGMSKEQISLALISDPNKSILNSYGLVHDLENSQKPVRGVYFIDPEGKIKAIFFYPLFNGRSVKEIMRLLAALQFSYKEKKITPEGWQKGDKGLDCPKCMTGSKCSY